MKTQNVIFARPVFATLKQKQEKNLREFFQQLPALSKDCDLCAVAVEEYGKEIIRNAVFNRV